MSTLLVSESDPRGPKALALAADAGQWLRCRDHAGRKAYGIRSSRGGCYYLVTRSSCTCRGFEFDHDCKHRLAVELHCRLVAEQRREAAAWTRPQRGVIPAA